MVLGRELLDAGVLAHGEAMGWGGGEGEGAWGGGIVLHV